MLYRGWCDQVTCWQNCTGQTKRWEKEAREIVNFKPKIESGLTEAMKQEIREMIKQPNKMKWK